MLNLIVYFFIRKNSTSLTFFSILCSILINSLTHLTILLAKEKYFLTLHHFLLLITLFYFLRKHNGSFLGFNLPTRKFWTLLRKIIVNISERDMCPTKKEHNIALFN